MNMFRNILKDYTDLNQQREKLDKTLETVDQIGEKAMIFYFWSLRKMGMKKYAEHYERHLKKEMQAYYKKWKITTMETQNKIEDERQRLNETFLAKVEKFEQISNDKNQNQLDRHQAELIRFKIENEEKLEQEKEEIRKTQRDKMEMIRKFLEVDRKLLSEMIQNDIKTRSEERLLLKQRWEREEQKRNEINIRSRKEL